MDDVNKPLDPRLTALVEAGAPVGDAIRIALGGNIPKWALANGIHRTPAAMTIYGKRVPPAESVLVALRKTLGGTEEEWKDLLHRSAQEALAQRQPTAAAV